MNKVVAGGKKRHVTKSLENVPKSLKNRDFCAKIAEY